jgi:hypothetical protein
VLNSVVKRLVVGVGPVGVSRPLESVDSKPDTVEDTGESPDSVDPKFEPVPSGTCVDMRAGPEESLETAREETIV